MFDSRAAKKLHVDTIRLPYDAGQEIPFFDDEWLPAPVEWDLLTVCKQGDWFCILDAEDRAWALQWTWFLIPSGYAVRNRRKEDGPGSHIIYLHREIAFRKSAINHADIMVADHINGCPFDNRRINLRWATLSENAANRHGSYWREKYDIWLTPQMFSC